MDQWQYILLRVGKETVIYKIYSLMPVENQDPRPYVVRGVIVTNLPDVADGGTFLIGVSACENWHST